MPRGKPTRVMWGRRQYLVDIEDFVSSGFKPARGHSKIFFKVSVSAPLLSLISGLLVGVFDFG